MSDAGTLIENAYLQFNARNIDAALALMTDDVCWPKASEGGSTLGKAEIRAYWMRQWREFDPHVEPLSWVETREGRHEVRVRQLVRSLSGDVLSDSEVMHVFTVKDGLIQAMELGVSYGDSVAPPSAFTHRA